MPLVHVCLRIFLFVRFLVLALQYESDSDAVIKQRAESVLSSSMKVTVKAHVVLLQPGVLYWVCMFFRRAAEFLIPNSSAEQTEGRAAFARRRPEYILQPISDNLRWHRRARRGRRQGHPLLKMSS